MPIALVGVDKQPSVQQTPTAQAAVPEGHPVPAQQQNGEQGGSGNSNDQPRFISPVIRVDQSGLAVLQFRDGDTGEKTQQYPSEKAIREYRQFAQVENDVGPGAVVDNGESGAAGQGDAGAGGSSAAGSDQGGFGGQGMGFGGGGPGGGFGAGAGFGASTGGGSGSGSGSGSSGGAGAGSSGGKSSGTPSGAAGTSSHVSIKA
ncbi:MAG: hypothetical protein HQL40_10295 [Alphaproteobacteria bacterium]|nr:hypothetical protein [Alphaproteobacteria bacterium]